jgi:hypothetical protein
MQTPVRYYITCDDDRPVVRTIPVADHNRQDAVEQPVAAGKTAQTAKDVPHENRKPRMSKLALAKARQLRVRAHHS